ncbi:hypothetical protein B0H14DRAFT_3573711 [Mycena olivaceomarginata]|nr:hypothetical protein B0H14DRAFT_3573711 [Mycena olivaceomarginata]
MPLVKGLLESIINYRLGYSPTRPYAWRWTTPVAFGVFLVVTIILALINVPLSAYIIVTEATYTPNASLPVLPLSGLVPSIFQESSYSGSFSPQTLTPGQILRPNGSIFSYNIVGAYNGFDISQPVTSFSYYNNPLSDSCDVTNMTIHAQESGVIQQGLIQITCWTPTVYILSFDIKSVLSSTDADDIRFTSLNGFYNDLAWTWYYWSETRRGWNSRSNWCTGSPWIIITWWYTSFLVIDGDVALNNSLAVDPTSNNTDFFFPDRRLDGTSFAGLNTLLHNLFQAMYHGVRLDLGISQPNQIYTSADRYSRSISTVYIPGVWFEGGPDRMAFSNTSLLDSYNLTTRWTAEQQDVVRVPVMSYIRTVPRLKPLGAAITSVFVSTFAMVSVLRQVFSFIAAALSDKGNGKSILIMEKYTSS